MMWKDKQAGQSKLGKRGCRGTKGLWECCCTTSLMSDTGYETC